MTVSQEAQARAKITSEFEPFFDPLPTEADLLAMWGDSDKVVASIACATFEHGALLEDAIRSFLMQKTDFRFEIVIRDDASTDGSRDLIVDYMQRYPRIIKALIYDENQFKLGRRPGDDLCQMTCGDYVALCEGDDFWIDRDKLQDQVAQLERHPDCVISVAGTLVYEVLEDALKATKYILGLVANECVHPGIPPQYHHTSTLVIRRWALEKTIAKQKKYGIYGDLALRHLLVEHGKCICLPRLVSVYWVNGFGIWSALSNEQKGKAQVDLFAGLIRLVPYRSKLAILGDFFNACSDYFPIALRKKEWRFVAACCGPFIVRKLRNLSRRIVRRLRMRRET